MPQKSIKAKNGEGNESQIRQTTEGAPSPVVSLP